MLFKLKKRKRKSDNKKRKYMGPRESIATSYSTFKKRLLGKICSISVALIV